METLKRELRLRVRKEAERLKKEAEELEREGMTYAAAAARYASRFLMMVADGTPIEEIDLPDGTWDAMREGYSLASNIIGWIERELEEELEEQEERDD